MVGDFRHAVAVEAPTGPADPPTWYCSVEPAANTVVDGHAAYFLRGRYHPEITLETVLDFEGRRLQVQAVTDVDERHVSMTLVAVEVRGRV
jgi:hypothetical protein